MYKEYIALSDRIWEAVGHVAPPDKVGDKYLYTIPLGDGIDPMKLTVSNPFGSEADRSFWAGLIRAHFATALNRDRNQPDDTWRL